MKKRMSKKGAMELSMNTIVIVVIGITLLVLGLVFVRGIFTKLGGLGTEAFQQAEQELKQIQAGDTKINFPASIDVKKGKSSSPTLRICNIDGTLNGGSLELEQSGFYTGLTITVKGQPITSTTTSPVTIDLDEVTYQTCLPLPVLVTAQPTTVVNPNEQPFLTLTVKTRIEGRTTVYDSIGTIITVT